MFEHCLRPKAPVRALAVLAALASAIVYAPNAQAVRPGGNGRIAYLKAFTGPGGGFDVVVWDGRYPHSTESHDFLDRVTWCGSDLVVTVRKGVGIVAMPVDRDENLGTIFPLYDDPTNTLHDPACNAAGTRLAAADQAANRIVTLPVSGRRGITSPVASTALDGMPSEPTWSSNDEYIAYEDNPGTGVSVIEVAAASRRYVGSGTVVTPSTEGLRHGPSWREDTIYYWKQATPPPPANPGPSLGIFSVRLGDINEFGPYGGTSTEKCTDPAALPDGSGFLCVGADTFIKRFPGPHTLIDTDAVKPDVERQYRDHHHDKHK
jgi:hypothetical protein